MADLMLNPEVAASEAGSEPASGSRSQGAARTAGRPLDLSVLIVTWNSERWIDRCLRSLPAACEGLEYEVIVHDNASHDSTLKHVHGAQVIRSSSNDGFAAGTNRAFATSRGRHVFLLNPDCELAPRAVTTLFEFLESHPAAAAAAPLLINEAGHSQREFQLRRFPTLTTLAVEALLVDKILPSNRVTAHYRYRDLDLSAPRRVEQPAAAALLLRREAVEEVGPLDEQFFPAWFEDVDYCRRLAANGKEIWAVPAAQARHFGGASLEHITFAGFADLWYRNMYRYARKWLPPGEAEMVRWAVIGGMLLRFGAGLAGFKPKGVTRRDAFRAYSTVLRKALDRWSEGQL